MHALLPSTTEKSYEMGMMSSSVTSSPVMAILLWEYINILKNNNRLNDYILLTIIYTTLSELSFQEDTLPLVLFTTNNIRSFIFIHVIIHMHNYTLFTLKIALWMYGNI